MKKLLLTACISLTMLVFNVSAQTKDTTPAERVVYSKVDEKPVFPGGKGAMVKFILDHMGYSEDIKRGGEQSGTVLVEFLISPNGKVIEPKVIKNISPELDNEALRIVDQMPKWKPGKKDGKPVFVKLVVPVKFALKD